MREGYRAAIESGELAYAAFTLSGLLINGLPAAVPLADVLAEAELGLEFVSKNKNQIGRAIKLPFRQLVRALTGRTASPASFDDDDFQEAAFLEQANGNDTALGHYWVVRLQAAYLAGDPALARQCSERAVAALPGILGMFTAAEHLFYSALTLAALHDTAQAEDRPGLLQQIGALRDRLAGWASACPANFRHKQALVEAELARCGDDAWQAMQHYRAAIDGAAQEGFIQDEALANELRGRFLLGAGEPELASPHLLRARGGYRQWGATAKAHALEQAYPALFAAERARSVGKLGAVDALGLIKASQAISAETVPARLFERILRIVVEVAGAEQGVLILGEPGALTVRARVATDDSTASLDAVPLAD